MHAVILAGGLGTRLRPLTYTTPKPLLPIMNEPMVERLIKTLPIEIDTVVLAVSYMVDKLRKHFEEHDVGRKVILVEEKDPLGTGGAIQNVKAHLSDTFVVFNGDVISSLDVSAILDFHKKKKGVGTIAMWEVEDPTRYGIIGFDDDFRITKFLEKPSPEEVFSHWINAGVYVLEPEIIDSIEPQKKTSIEREIFPPLAASGKLFGFTFRGFWLDAGTPEAYLMTHRTLLDQQPQSSLDLGIDVKINHPVLLGENCKIEAEAELGPHACLGNNVEIKKGTKIKTSVIMDNVFIGSNNNLMDSIVGFRVTIEDDVNLGSDLVIADDQVLKKGPDIPANSKIKEQ
jgi:mannose-1-phosphate guanylyltransferase